MSLSSEEKEDDKEEEANNNKVNEVQEHEESEKVAGVAEQPERVHRERDHTSARDSDSDDLVKTSGGARRLRGSLARFSAA